MGEKSKEAKESEEAASALVSAPEKKKTSLGQLAPTQRHRRWMRQGQSIAIGAPRKCIMSDADFARAQEVKS